MPESALYRATVTHTRTGKVRHRLRHSVFYLYLDLDEIGRLERKFRLFSRNRFNLVSFHDRDHGPRDGRPLKAWIADQLKCIGLYDPQGRIGLLTLPRICGYAFNPLSMYYCFDRAGVLVAVLHEVRNTFGELHGYLIPARPSPGGIIHQEAAKRFYVSPFIDMEAHYRFRLNVPAEQVCVAIRETIADGSRLTATLRGVRRPLTDGELWRAVAAMPLMGFKVIAAIHWHAIRLWLKGERVRPRPRAPRELVSTGGAHSPTTGSGLDAAAR